METLKQERLDQIANRLGQNNESLDAEDEFFEEYRKQRLQQLQKQYAKKQLENASMSSTSHSKNSFKNLQKFFYTYSEITLNDYAQLTDLDQKAQTKNLTTIVHFYDEGRKNFSAILSTIVYPIYPLDLQLPILI